MLKRLLIVLFFSGFFAEAQTNEQFYKVHALQITSADKLFAGKEVDFGYNFTESVNNDFIHNGYYLWIEDQWFYIMNAKNIFNSDTASPLLFNITAARSELKIQDIFGTVYTYPIEAIKPYEINKKDYLNWKQKPESLIYSTKMIDSPLAPTLQYEETVKTEVPKAEEPKTQKEEAAVASEETSPLLDVLDIVETTVKTTVATDEAIAIQNTVIANDTVADLKEQVKEVSQTEKKVPLNAYEEAVEKGFEGSVTEWIEEVNSKGGKTAYEMAVEKGFKGDEKEWLRSLWGSNVDPDIEKQEKTTTLVMNWMQELNSDAGYSPYELALKNGFYGTFSEWVEFVIGKDGEEAYKEEIKKGYKGTYKEWIETKLKASNDDMLRKEKLRKNNFVIVPNVRLEIPDNDEIQTFDLYKYYNQYYGSSVISSSGRANSIELRKSDLEYQLTWYDKSEIEILEISKDGLIKYKKTADSENKYTSINVRYVLSN